MSYNNSISGVTSLVSSLGRIGNNVSNKVYSIQLKTHQLCRKAYDTASKPIEAYEQELKKAIKEGNEKLTGQILSQFSLNDRQELRENLATNLFITVLKRSPNVSLIQLLFKMNIQTPTLQEIYESCTVKKTKKTFIEEDAIEKERDASLQADEDSSWLDLAKDTTIIEDGANPRVTNLQELEKYKINAFRQYFEVRVHEKIIQINVTMQSVTPLPTDLCTVINGYMIEPKSDEEIEIAIKERNKRILDRIVVEFTSSKVVQGTRYIIEGITGTTEL